MFTKDTLIQPNEQLFTKQVSASYQSWNSSNIYFYLFSILNQKQKTKLEA